MVWKGVILIFNNDDLQCYKLSCCRSFALGFFSFFQIVLGHAVSWYVVIKGPTKFGRLPTWLRDESNLLFLPVHHMSKTNIEFCTYNFFPRFSFLQTKYLGRIFWIEIRIDKKCRYDKCFFYTQKNAASKKQEFFLWKKHHRIKN